MVAAGRHVIALPSEADWNTPWRLWCIGDIHWGAKGCDEELVGQTVARIAQDDRARWVGMGDYIDLISMRDQKRFDPEAISEKHQASYFKHYGPEMRNYAIEQFKPIAGQCIGLLLGNHEWKYSMQYEQAIVQDMCEALDAPFLGYCAFRDLLFVDPQNTARQERFRIIAHHGAGYARTKGGKLNRLLGLMHYFDADIYLMGHVHARLDDDTVVVGADDDCLDLTQRSRAGVVSGTYLKTYALAQDGASSYGERAMYEPTPLGSPCIRILPGSRKLAVEKP